VAAIANAGADASAPHRPAIDRLPLTTSLEGALAGQRETVQ